MSNTALKVDDYYATQLGDSRIRQADVGSALPDATGANVIDWSGVFERYARRPKKYPIWNVSVDGKPFEVTVFKDGAYWFAENEAYNVAGHGESISDALLDALEAIRYLAGELLTESDEALSDHAQALKQKYARVQIA